MASKEEARGRFRELRHKSQSLDRTLDRKGPSRVLLTAPEIHSAQVIASFQSYGDEPDTFDLHASLKSSGKKILLPRMNPDKSLTWLHEGDEVGVELLNSIDLVIVPALAIDMRGVRLGQGGGSYDRALPRFNAWKIALIHHGELTSEPMPVEEHDAKVDAAATPDLVVRFL